MHSRPVHLFGQSLVGIMLVFVRWLEIIFLSVICESSSIDQLGRVRGEASIAGVSGPDRYHSIKQYNAKSIHCEFVAQTILG